MSYNSKQVGDKTLLADEYFDNNPTVILYNNPNDVQIDQVKIIKEYGNIVLEASHNNYTTWVELYGNVKVVFYDANDFTGEAYVVSHNSPTRKFIEIGLPPNDTISSIRIENPTEYETKEVDGKKLIADYYFDTNPMVVFYSHPDIIQTQHVHIFRGETEISNVNIQIVNDRYSRLEVFGDLELQLFAQENFKGASKTITHNNDTRLLRELDDFNDSTVSFKLIKKETKEKKCPEGKEIVNGECVDKCPAGMIRDKDGNCIKPPLPINTYLFIGGLLTGFLIFY